VTRKTKLTRTLERRLVAGLIVIAPVTVTGIILWWIFERLDGLLGRFLYPILDVPIPGLGLLALLLLLFLVGWAAERAIGARVLGWWQLLLERIPLTRRLYVASSRIIKTVFGEERAFFREVVLFQYPSPGRWSVGFVTATAPAAMQEHVQNGVVIFVPTSPNPTSGFLVIVPREEVIQLPLTLEEGFTFVLSAGGVAPEAAEEPPPPMTVLRSAR
jgi:uncharacterized membrane protein